MIKIKPAGQPPMPAKPVVAPQTPRKPRSDKGERRSLHPQSHDEFMKLGHSDT